MTLIITCMLFSCLNRRATLSTLKVLSTLIALNAEPPPEPITAVKSISKIERETIPPSSQFILSLKYFTGPIAIIRLTISQMKIHVKISPANSIIYTVIRSILYFCMDMPTVLSRTKKVIRFPNYSCLTNILSRTLAFFRVPIKPGGQTRTLFIVDRTSLARFIFRPTSSTS